MIPRGSVTADVPTAWDRLGPRVVLLLAADEAAGHPFRGNQYVGGEGGGSGKPKMSIAQFSKQKLLEGHSPAKVAEMAQKAFGSKTTAASVAWYKSQMNKEAKAKAAGPKPGSIEAIVQQHAPKPSTPKPSTPKPSTPKLPGQVAAEKQAKHDEMLKQMEKEKQAAALAKQAAAQKAAPIGVLKEEDYVGGKAYYKMTAAEKEQAAKVAQSIIDKPENHDANAQLAAQMFKAHHEKQLAFAKEQADKEAKSTAAAKEASKPLSAPSSPLTDKEYNAAKAYTGSSYVNMNHLSRSGTLDQYPAMAAKVKALDSAIEKSSLEKDLTLYRGIPADAAKKMFPGGVVQTGQVVSDKGFSSTSLKQSVALNFSKGVVLHIDAPKGAKALDVRHLSQHKSEDEVVLPRDAKLRVVGVLVSDSTKDFLHVKVEYVA